LSALIDQLNGLARGDPVLMVFEDAQWSDPTSLELLTLTVEHMQALSPFGRTSRLADDELLITRTFDHRPRCSLRSGRRRNI
jgi:predicted ATPase